MSSVPVVASVTPSRGPVARGVLPKKVSSDNIPSSKVYLKFEPSAINPLGVVGHEVRITKVLDLELDFAGRVENTRVRWAAIIDMGNDGRIVEYSGVGHNGLVPSPKIRVALDQVWQGGPFV